MLYYLFQWLDKYDFPGAGMFGYTSFRSKMASRLLKRNVMPASTRSA